jgi:hypothetical protein
LNLPHLHLLLNHWPIIGAFIAFGLFVLALVMRSNDVKQASLALFAVLALLALPTYLSGNAASDSLTKSKAYSKSVQKELIDNHEGAALLALSAIELTGLVSLVGLWQFSRKEKDPSNAAAWISMTVFVLGLITVGLMTVTGTSGGDIRHPEIMEAGEAPSGIATLGARWILSIRYFVIDYSRWVWPILETLHFLGLILLIGTIGLLSLRILGFLKQVPVGPLHRFIPLGIAGFIVNIITGFMFFVGMPFFYVFNWFFQMKILTILIAGVTLVVFYCTGSFRKWGALGANEDAPGLAKLVAVSSIVLWIAIVVLGRYIPVGESAQ